MKSEMTNQDIMNKYLVERQANEISPETLRLDLCVLTRLNKDLEKPFKSATKDDMIRFFNRLKREGFTRKSLHTYKGKVKVFYNWLYGLDYREYPACVKWIRSTNPRSTKAGGLSLPVKIEDLLSPQDIKALINACDHPRDQALVALLYETAGRAKEVLGLKVDSVKFDEYGAKVTLEGDSGARVIRLVDSVPYLEVWLNVHPYRDKSDSSLWSHKRKGFGAEQQIKYHNLRKILLRLKEKAGIEKPVRAHLFRHARLTELAKYLTEHKLKVFAGWSPGSNMAGIYVHLSGKDLDNDILELHGVKAKPQEKPFETSSLAPTKCGRCQKENPATATYCYQCGMVLNEDVARKIAEQEKRELAWIDEGMKQLRKELNELRKMVEEDRKPRIPEPKIVTKAIKKAFRDMGKKVGEKSKG